MLNIRNSILENLTQQQLEKVQKLVDYDLSLITNNFIDKGRQFSAEQIWPLKEKFGVVDISLATILEQEFKKFMLLKIVKDGNEIIPSAPVDMYWHFFLLHTREYVRFGEIVFPNESQKEGIKIEEPNEVEITKSLNNSVLLSPSTYQELSLETKRMVKRVELWDLSYFSNQLVAYGKGFIPEQCKPIIAHFSNCDIRTTTNLSIEFKKFILLTLLDPQMCFGIAGPVDMFWHFMILHWEKYRVFAESIWGEFQHHPRGSRHPAEFANDHRLNIESLHHAVVHDPCQHLPSSENYTILAKHTITEYNKVFRDSISAQLWFYEID